MKRIVLQPSHEWLEEAGFSPRLSGSRVHTLTSSLHGFLCLF